MEENLAVVQISGRAWVRQHLTNDYNRIRDAIGEYIRLLNSKQGFKTFVWKVSSNNDGGDFLSLWWKSVLVLRLLFV